MQSIEQPASLSTLLVLLALMLKKSFTTLETLDFTILGNPDATRLNHIVSSSDMRPLFLFRSSFRLLGLVVRLIQIQKITAQQQQQKHADKKDRKTENKKNDVYTQ